MGPVRPDNTLAMTVQDDERPHHVRLACTFGSWRTRVTSSHASAFSKISEGMMADYYGDSSNNTFTGTAAGELIFGFGGLDNLSGAGGNDEIYGGDSNDTLNGGDNNDLIYGGSQNDGIFGGNGDDALHGDRGDDTIQGGNDNDFLYGGDGIDNLLGEAGNDRLYGGAGIDFIYGGANNDELYGGGALDHLYGGDGIDLVHGGDGDDQITISLTDLVADNDIRGDAGIDMLIVNSDNTNQIAAFTTGAGVIDGFAYQSMERLTWYGGIGNETVTGASYEDVLDGASGIDTLNGAGGNDSVYGGDGNDMLNGGAGEDFIYGGNNNDTLVGGADNDAMFGNNGNDKIQGDEGIDSLFGNDGDDIFFYRLPGAGSGFDFVDGGIGNDTVRGFANNAVISLADFTSIERFDNGGFANVTIAGGETDDFFDFSGSLVVGINAINGNDGNDSIYGSSGNNRINGGNGEDSLYGVNGADILNGGADADYLVGSQIDSDRFEYSSVNDSRYSIDPDQIADFEVGIDKIHLAAIDADTTVAGNQVFAYIGSAAFTLPGQIRIDTTTVTGQTQIYGNVDADLAPELHIILLNGVTPLIGDYVL